MKKRIFITVALLLIIVRSLYAWNGNVTENNTYLLNDKENWNTLAENVVGGESNSSVYFKLYTLDN